MGSLMPAAAAPVVEPDNVPEFFVTDLADCQLKKGLIRLAFSCDRANEMIVRVRLVMPLESERAISRRIAELFADFAGATRVN